MEKQTSRLFPRQRMKTAQKELHGRAMHVTSIQTEILDRSILREWSSTSTRALDVGMLHIPLEKMSIILKMGDVKHI